MKALQSAAHAPGIGFDTVHFVGLGFRGAEVEGELVVAVAVVEGGEAAAPVGDGLGGGDLGGV